MNLNYNEVPNIISTKDLAYLCDLFNLNYNIYKNTLKNILYIQDEEIKTVINDTLNLFLSNMQSILNILGGINE